MSKPANSLQQTINEEALSRAQASWPTTDTSTASIPVRERQWLNREGMVPRISETAPDRIRLFSLLCTLLATIPDISTKLHLIKEEKFAKYESARQAFEIRARGTPNGPKLAAEVQRIMRGASQRTLYRQTAPHGLAELYTLMDTVTPKSSRPLRPIKAANPSPQPRT